MTLKVLAGKPLPEREQHDSGHPAVLQGADRRLVLIQTPGVRLTLARHGLRLQYADVPGLEPDLRNLLEVPGFVEVIPDGWGHDGRCRWRVRGYRNRPRNDLATWAGGREFRSLDEALAYAETCELETIIP